MSIYSAVLHVGSGYWMLGRIENHVARPLSREEVDQVALALNEAKPSRVAALVEEALDGKSFATPDTALSAQLGRVRGLQGQLEYLRGELGKEQQSADQLNTDLDRTRTDLASALEELRNAKRTLAEQGGD